MKELTKTEAEKQGDILIAKDKVRDIALTYARDEAWGAWARFYTGYRFIPFLNIYYYFKAVDALAAYQSVKYGKSKTVYT